MTARPAGLVTIILVALGTITADWSSVKLCPCIRGCCDEHWFQYKDACYWPGNNPQPWNDAEESCAAQDAQLASVHTPEEDQFIFYLMGRRGSYWLGAKKSNRDHDSHWHWTDNSSWDYATVKLSSKSQMWKNHVIVERPDDDDDESISPSLSRLLVETQELANQALCKLSFCSKLDECPSVPAPQAFNRRLCMYCRCSQVSWKYEIAFNKRHMFVCKYLLV